MNIDKLIQFFMPSKIKLLLFFMLFLILPCLLIDSAGIHIVLLLGGLILIPLLGFANPISHILLIIEAYFIASLLVNHFAPSTEQNSKTKEKQRQKERPIYMPK